MPPLNLYARVRIFFAPIAHETAGAACTRHSLLPLFRGLRKFDSKPRAMRREIVRSCLLIEIEWALEPLPVIASVAKQSILPFGGEMDCFVAALPCANASRLSQAMTVASGRRPAQPPIPSATPRKTASPYDRSSAK